jgi:multidrug efflux pump subunit AcrB
MMRNISEWSIRNPIPTIVLFVVLTVTGVASFFALGIDLDPNTDLPMVSVTVTQTGAAPTELETQVTRKIEQAVAGVGNIKHIVSTVSDGGSNTRIEFNLGTNLDRALNDVRDAVTKVRQQLPQDIDEPSIERLDSNSWPFMGYTLSSPKRSAIELSEIAELQIARALLSVKGVSRINNYGVKREIRVHLDPLRLQALGITTDQVDAQIRALNINLPGGRGQVGAGEQAIRALGSAATVAELQRAHVALPGVELGPALKIVHQLPALQRLPDGVSEQLAGEAENQRDVFNGFGFALAAAILLIYAVLILLFGGFFQPLTIMMSLPLSLGGALIGLIVFGKSLGLYTLIGIIMLMGLVCKNAILLVEYCLMTMGEGYSRREAVLKAGEARMWPILMTTVAMIAGMLPIALGWGAGSEARSPMAVAVVGGLVTSTLLTLVIVPVVFTLFDDLQGWLGRTLGRRSRPLAVEAVASQQE